MFFKTRRWWIIRQGFVLEGRHQASQMAAFLCSLSFHVTRRSSNTILGLVETCKLLFRSYVIIHTGYLPWQKLTQKIAIQSQDDWRLEVPKIEKCEIYELEMFGFTITESVRMLSMPVNLGSHNNLNLIIISKHPVYSITKKGPWAVDLTLGSNWEVGWHCCTASILLTISACIGVTVNYYAPAV